MTPQEFGKIIKSKICGAFLFYGEEQYLKSYYMQSVKMTVCPNGEDEFNYVSLSGENLSVEELCSSVLSNASMPSFSGGQRLIVVYDFDMKKIKEEQAEQLCELFDELAAIEDSVVIFDTRPENFDAGTTKKPTKVFALFSKHIKSVFFDKESPEKLAVWVAKHFQHSGISVDKNICLEIISYCGRDMTTLNNEIQKLVFYLKSKERTGVSKEDVYAVCCGNKEIDTFDFSNAILNGNTEKAFYVLSDMKSRKQPPEIILGSIMSVYNDLLNVKLLVEAGCAKKDILQKLGIHEYKTGLYMQRVERLSRKGLVLSVSLCHDADLKIKTAQFDGYATIDTLVVKLAMAGRVK